jgi:hypothetical protein
VHRWLVCAAEARRREAGRQAQVMFLLLCSEEQHRLSMVACSTDPSSIKLCVGRCRSDSSNCVISNTSSDGSYVHWSAELWQARNRTVDILWTAGCPPLYRTLLHTLHVLRVRC